MKSFRVRVIVWTTFIAGSVMLGFGIAGNLAYQRVKLGQVDELLQAVVRRAAPPPAHERFWERSGQASVRELEVRLGAPALLAVYAVEGPVSLPVEEGSEIWFWGDWDRALGSGPLELPEVSGELQEEGVSPMPGRGRGGAFGGGPGRLGAAFAQPRSVELSTRSGADGASSWRFALARYEGYNVLAASDLSTVSGDARLARNAFAIAFPVALLAMGLGIWFFVTRAMTSLRQLASTIEGVSAKRLDARIASEGEYAEFGRLIELFNAMLERLEKSFAQATRFSADAAHELKTPLTILQGQLEQALQEAVDDSAQQRQIASLLDETHRLKSITRKLLLLAQADAGRLDLQREVVDVRALLEDCVELAREGDARATIRLQCGEGPHEAWCDAALTGQILQNLMSNALKYRYPEAAAIEVRLEADGERIVVEFENACHALDASRRARLFERFARGDAARSRERDGAGLGLSLSLEFAQAQGGELAWVELGDDGRLRLRLSLPRADSSARRL